MPEMLIGAQAIADHLKITRRQVYRLCQAGGLPIWKEEGAGVCSTVQDLDAYLARRAAEARAKPHLKAPPKSG